MLDVRTYFVTTVVTALVLAATLWLGSSRNRGDGLNEWITSLLLIAGAGVLFALRQVVPDALSIVVANMLLGVAMSMQAAAVLSFHGHKLPASVHGGFALLIGVVFSLLIGDFRARTVASGLLYGGVLAAMAYLLCTARSEVRPATRRLMIASSAIASSVFLVRAFIGLFVPSAVGEFMQVTAMQTGTLVFGHAVIVSNAVGFLLMHKDRADYRVQKLATTDSLTGDLNRRTFLEMAEKEISRARRLNAPLSLIMLDLDHFKEINDRYGHLTGDEVLRRFSAVVHAQLRREDMLVRYGGEEFCVMLPDVAGPGAVALASRIRKAVAHEPFEIGSLRVPVTVSAGVAARLDGEETVGAILARADEALYLAKKRGRNRVAAVSLGKSIAA